MPYRHWEHKAEDHIKKSVFLSLRANLEKNQIQIYIKANDGLNNNRATEYEKSLDFRYTLDDVAWEWHDCIVLADRNAMQALFHRYFYIQVRLIKHLCQRSRDFKFDPHTDNTENFNTDVKQTAISLTIMILPFWT